MAELVVHGGNMLRHEKLAGAERLERWAWLCARVRGFGGNGHWHWKARSRARHWMNSNATKQIPIWWKSGSSSSNQV